METPSSQKRITRSQALLARNAAVTTINNNNIPISRNIEDSEKIASKSRARSAKQQQQDRSALIDITNDSPIVGLAMGSLKTPSSNKAKNSGTPGSGEALLRGQVKTLLQRVEEEADITKLSFQNRPFLHLQGFVDSPIEILAPTPANTPQVPNLSGHGDIIISLDTVASPLPFVEEQLKICQVAMSDMFNGKREESLESEKSLTRSLLLDFSEKTETSDDLSEECSSVLTYQGVEGVTAGESKDKSPATNDDDASIWSIQVNASVYEDEEEEEEEEEGEEEGYNYEDDDRDNEFIELCEVLSKISVKEKAMPKFTGKHTRFVYNEDEIVGQVECAQNEGPAGGSCYASPSFLHFRFSMEEGREED